MCINMKHFLKDDFFKIKKLKRGEKRIMARPSQNLDKKMIELGKEKLVTQGLSNLSVRQICLDAGINLGMFYYYFKSKENYIKSLFKSLNDDLKASWLIELEKLSTSVEKLKKVLFLNAKMFKDHRGMIETIMKDTDIFDKMYRDIGKELHDAWLKFYGDLINECKNDGYLSKDVENDKLISILTGSVHAHAKICENNGYDTDKYYASIKDVIDLIVRKFKPNGERE
jgi:Transcriptional regulator